jgi:hypothetical protein
MALEKGHGNQYPLHGRIKRRTVRARGRGAGLPPYAVALAKGRGFVTDQYDGTVSVFDLTSLAAVKRIDVGAAILKVWIGPVSFDFFDIHQLGGMVKVARASRKTVQEGKTA